MPEVEMSELLILNINLYNRNTCSSLLLQSNYYYHHRHHDH